MKIIGMIPVYNDEDIIEEVLEHLLSQGLELVVLDNGSTDTTYEKCRKYAERGQIKLESFKTKTYDQHWGLIIRALYDMALGQKPDWVVRIDSDEFLESGIKGMTLKDRIIQADIEGYNLIQFNVFDFFMTDNDNENAKSIKEKMLYYTYKNDFNYRAWKFSLAINVEWTSHLPIFPEGKKYKISPKKMVLRHYPFRSKQQAEKKIRDKIRGIDKQKLKEGLPEYSRKLIDHSNDVTKKIDHRILSRYNDDEVWNYKSTFSYSWAKTPPKQLEIFTKDGKLRWNLKTINEVQIELNNLRQKNIELRLRHKGYQLKTLIKKNFFS